MPTVAPKNFHLPLPPALYADLRAAAEQAGTPATEVAREAIQSWLKEARRRKVREELRDFARAYAGTEWDLNPAAAAAGAQSFLDAYPDDDWSAEPSYPGGKPASQQKEKTVRRAPTVKSSRRAKA